MKSKDKILAFLEYNKDAYISGEAMATQLGLSRNSVWKNINELRKAGYNIEAVSNRGYRLMADNDIISVQGLAPFLADDLPIADINIYDEVESTNSLAKELALEGAEHGTVIISSKQTHGRGHGGSDFPSPEGGIYMSVILDPAAMDLDRPSHIPAFTAVSVCQVFEELLDLAPSINLVTDIFVDGAKVCGILNETAFDLETEQLQWIVVGIGIPDKYSVSRNEIVAAILNKLLVTPDYAAIMRQYKKLHKK